MELGAAEGTEKKPHTVLELGPGAGAAGRGYGQCYGQGEG